MSEKTLEEIINEEQGVNQGPNVEVELEEESSGLNIDFGFIWADTGEGNIEDYLDHPLNFNQSIGLAQVLRGLTGMFGSLKKAIIDIALGTMQLSKERRG